jgi:p-cumate 2,3-dioxygenase ferredoxin component
MTFLCNTADIPAGEVRRFELPTGHAIAIYHLSSGFYATDDLCTHGEASLADGEIDADTIVCPYHLGAFCIKTGAPTAAPCSIPLRVYPLSVDGDEINVQIE